MNTTAIILAAGNSERLPGGVPKQFRPLAGMPVLAHTLRKFEQCDAVNDVIVVVPREYIPFTYESIVDKYTIKKVRSVVSGGDSRFQSLMRGLAVVLQDTDIVITHDAVRPLVSPDLISETVRTCITDGAAVAALKAGDAVKRVENGYVLATLDRERMYLVQTPQAFKSELLRDVYKKSTETGSMFPDEASAVEAAGHKIRIVEGDPMNLKIVLPSDLDLVRFCMSSTQGQENG